MTKMTKNFMKIALLATIVANIAAPSVSAAAESAKLTFVDSLNIPGSFVSQDQIAIDDNYIYLASSQGDLFVLKNKSRENFPFHAKVTVADTPLTAVALDRSYIYVTAVNGQLSIYEKGSLALKHVASYSSYGLNDVDVIDGKIYLALGQAEIKVTKSHVFLTGLNPGDYAIELLPANQFALGNTYGVNFEADKTSVYNRVTAEKITSLSNPLDLNGNLAQPELEINRGSLTMVVPGCCGQGVEVYDTSSFDRTKNFNLPFANTVITESGKTISGHENGMVNLIDWENPSNPIITSINLPAVTGLTNPEDIEIRAVVISGNYIIAASSWGNDQTRSHELPSVFIVKIK